MRRIALLLAASGLLAAAAHAQVAVPELVPAAPRYYLPGAMGFNGGTVSADNPAALQWGEPARAAFAIVSLDSENPGAGTTSGYSGYFGGYRGIMDKWAFALEHLTVEEDAGNFDETASSGQFSFQILEGLALGAGVDLAETDTGAGSQDVESNTFGLSVSLQEKFYIGYAIGRDKYEDSGGTTGARDTTLIGVALRLGDGWRWLLAYDLLDKDDFDTTGGGGFDARTLSVQVAAGSLVAGLASVTYEPKGGGSTFEATVVDFGWAPESGLTLTARYSDGERTAAGVVTEKDTGTSVIIGYLF